jgi:CheY-like chemotaxis protein
MGASPSLLCGIAEVTSISNMLIEFSGCSSACMGADFLFRGSALPPASASLDVKMAVSGPRASRTPAQFSHSHFHSMQNRPIHILLVEDNAADVRLVRDALGQQQLVSEIHQCSDGEQALAYLARMRTGADDAPYPQVVLLDLNIPKGEGFEILNALRASEQTAHIPAIVMSSSDSPVDRGRAAQAGGAVYFRKPLDLDEFMKLGCLVRDVLHKSGDKSGTGEANPLTL